MLLQAKGWICFLRWRSSETPIFQLKYPYNRLEFGEAIETFSLVDRGQHSPAVGKPKFKRNTEVVFENVPEWNGEIMHSLPDSIGDIAQQVSREMGGITQNLTGTGRDPFDCPADYWLVLFEWQFD